MIHASVSPSPRRRPLLAAPLVLLAAVLLAAVLPAISADPDTSGRTRLLWQHYGGASCLWTLGPTGALQGSAARGTY